MPESFLTARISGAAKVEPRFGGDSFNPGGYHLALPAGKTNQFRLAQLDDYSSLPRRKFRWQPSLALSLRARVSAQDHPGTWGFGVWNDPFGLSLGFGGNTGRLPILPNAAWFFHASAQNYLSFREDKPANGFLAQSFCSPCFHPLLIPAGLIFPFSRKRTRSLLSRIIKEDGIRLNVDVTRWNHYRMEWNPQGVACWVNDDLVMVTPVSPRPPLGFVIWIDNQFAAFWPDGGLRWGLQENSLAWLDIEQINISTEI